MSIINYRIDNIIRGHNCIVGQSVDDNTIIIMDDCNRIVNTISCDHYLDKDELLRTLKQYVDKPGSEFEYVWI